MGIERRKGLREATDVLSVQFFDESERDGGRRLHKGLVENCSSGGMYITTDHPFDRGSVVTVKFQADSEKIRSNLPFEVRATVRWVRKVTSPKGMGVEFLEYSGITEEKFKERIAVLEG